MGNPKDDILFTTWERDLNIIFGGLCLKEVELSNEPTTHFNNEGWLNIMISFQEKTRREYN